MIPCSAVYGRGSYGIAHYKDELCLVGTAHNTLFGKPLSHKLRRDFARKVIFRIRQGNGYAESVVGRDYQDRYKYFVPSTINHPNGEPQRNRVKACASEWNALTPELKKMYNSLAASEGGLTGYNLFFRNYMKEALNEC